MILLRKPGMPPDVVNNWSEYKMLPSKKRHSTGPNLLRSRTVHQTRRQEPSDNGLRNLSAKSPYLHENVLNKRSRLLN